MKQKYERPNIKFILLDERDVITLSAEQETLLDDNSIGGSGYDADGWT